MHFYVHVRGTHISALLAVWCKTKKYVFNYVFSIEFCLKRNILGKFYVEQTEKISCIFAWFVWMTRAICDLNLFFHLLCLEVKTYVSIEFIEFYS